MKSFETLLSLTKNMSRDELQALSSQIVGLLQESPDKDVPNNCIEHKNECRRCGMATIVKYGKDKNGTQRYKCKNCGIVFNDASFSVVARTRFGLDVWEKYVQLLLDGASLSKCASACGISVQTAFTWRHKILNALQKDQDDRMLGGIVETDETYFSISYKGNHKKSKYFTMPRKAHKRGTDGRDQIGSRACVMCASERNGQTYGEVLGKGQPTIAMLSHAFDNRILKESIVLSDKAIGIKNYFKNNTDIELVQLLAHIRPKSMSSPPEVRGALHIQNINNLHARFRRFLRPYNGVATKYLNHYLNLFIWIENHKKIAESPLETQLFKTIGETNSFISHSTIVHLPPIPQVA